MSLTRARPAAAAAVGILLALGSALSQAQQGLRFPAGNEPAAAPADDAAGGTQAELPPLGSRLTRPQSGLRIEPSIDAIATLTNNAAAGSFTGGRDKALILELRPRISFAGQSTRIRAAGSFGLQMLGYLKSEETSRIYPEGKLDANITVVERWIYVDTGVGASHASGDAFSLQSGDTPAADGRVTYRYRLSPYVHRELSPSLLLSARSDNYWTRLRADDSRGLLAEKSDAQQNTASLELRPGPLGGSVEAFDEQAKTDAVNATSLGSRGARLVVNYALTPELQIGGSVGHERSEINKVEQSDPTHGWRLRWAPSERARFEAQAEHRYFGWGGSGLASVRSPFMVASVEALRMPIMQSSPLVNVGAGQGLSAALDAILLTRYPDAAQRETLVRNLISQNGLSENVTGAVSVFPDYAQLLSRVTGSLVFLGRLTTLELRAYGEQSTILLRTDPSLLSPITTLLDNRQRGVSIAATRRLTQQLSTRLDLGLREIRGLNDAAGQLSREGTLTASARLRMGPRSEVGAGLRYRKFRSNVIPGSDTTAVFVGASHRF